MKKAETILASLTLLLIVLMLTPLHAQTPKLQEIDFIWEYTLDIGETQIPIRIYIPTTLTAEGLKDVAEPGEEIELEIMIKPQQGARIDVAQYSFFIDELFELATMEHPEFNLTIIPSLTSTILSQIIQTQLQMDQQKADELAETLAEYTELTISTNIEVQTIIEGPATVSPKTATAWFNEPLNERIRIDRFAQNNDLITVMIKPFWKLTLNLDLKSSIYENPTFGPLMKKLSSMIGIPLKIDLGVKTGDKLLEHIITIRTPLDIWIYILIAAASITAVTLLLLIYRPKKPSWQ